MRQQLLSLPLNTLKYMFSLKPTKVKAFKAPQVAKMPAIKDPLSTVPKYQGKGTRARLNTAATKMFFGSKFSK